MTPLQLSMIPEVPEESVEGGEGGRGGDAAEKGTMARRSTFPGECGITA